MVGAFICVMEHLTLTTRSRHWLPVAAIAALFSCTHDPSTAMTHNTQPDPTPAQAEKLDTIVLGAGCFWCVEAVFTELKGVLKVTPGYTGGRIENPDYKAICTGTTGHAEVAQVVFDPAVITVDELLEVFWQTHDPTTLNRQGHDVGDQYRSAIFYGNEEQHRKAEGYKARLDSAKAFNAPIVTEIAPLTKFYPAENYHKDYYANNPDQGYCQYVIRPKVEKFRKAFADKLK
jgi:peptide-methionine (S)-S-oxide reductase